MILRSYPNLLRAWLRRSIQGGFRTQSAPRLFHTCSIITWPKWRQKDLSNKPSSLTSTRLGQFNVWNGQDRTLEEALALRLSDVSGIFILHEICTAAAVAIVVVEFYRQRQLAPRGKYRTGGKSLDCHTCRNSQRRSIQAGLVLVAWAYTAKRPQSLLWGRHIMAPAIKRN